MKPTRTEDALRDLLRKGGFTPGARDEAAVVGLLADADPEIEREAERALARLGEEGLARLATRAGDPDARVRAGLRRVAGRVAPRGEADLPWILAGLRDADPRVQRHTAVALGKLRGSTAAPALEEALLAAWDGGPAPDLERAIAASLGKIGGARAAARLQAAAARDPETDRVTRKASIMASRDASRATPSQIDAYRTPDAPVRVALLCRAGLERVVADEARGCRGLSHVEPPIAGQGRVFARLTGPLAGLFSVRTASGFAVALAPVPLRDAPEDALARALTSDQAIAALEGWTVGVVRFRIAWASSGHQRARTWRAVEAIAARRPAWVNDPTESTWEVRAEKQGDALSVELHPRGLDDPRFAYRVRDVPAASHPPLAAAIVRVAGARPDDVVWDPFVGSGVELVERARAGPYARLLGSDIDPRALDAARANLAAAGVAGVRLEARGALDGSPEGVTLIVTNPPMGRRVARDGTLGELLDRFVDHAAEALPAGGRLVWLSPLGARTSARAAARGLSVTMDTEVDMGGFSARLQRCVREGRGG